MKGPQEEPLARALVMAGKALREHFEEALTRAGASLATWVVLNGIVRGQRESQRGLAEDLRIKGATLTRHLDRLEREGLVERTRDPDDHRQIRVELTPAGVQLHRRLRATARRVDARARTGMSDRDEATFRRLLGRIRENLGGDDAGDT